MARLAEKSAEILSAIRSGHCWKMGIFSPILASVFQAVAALWNRNTLTVLTHVPCSSFLISWAMGGPQQRFGESVQHIFDEKCIFLFFSPPPPPLFILTLGCTSLKSAQPNPFADHSRNGLHLGSYFPIGPESQRKWGASFLCCCCVHIFLSGIMRSCPHSCRQIKQILDGMYSLVKSCTDRRKTYLEVRLPYKRHPFVFRSIIQEPWTCVIFGTYFWRASLYSLVLLCTLQFEKKKKKTPFEFLHMGSF